MFQVLGYLVLETDATESDLSNAIYLALTNNELRSADEWIKKAIKKYPSSYDINALQAWNLRITNKASMAKPILENVLSKNQNHLIALIES
jgi:predicted Zn-dependent protease